MIWFVLITNDTRYKLEWFFPSASLNSCSLGPVAGQYNWYKSYGTKHNQPVVCNMQIKIKSTLIGDEQYLAMSHRTRRDVIMNLKKKKKKNSKNLRLVAQFTHVIMTLKVNKRGVQPCPSIVCNGFHAPTSSRRLID